VGSSTIFSGFSALKFTGI